MCCGALVIISAATLLLPGIYVKIIRLLHPASDQNSSRKIWKIYGGTQIFKYMPGNIFHFVGRQVEIRQLGIPHLVVANASLIETLNLVFSAMLCVLIFGNKQILDILGSTGFRNEQAAFLVGTIVISSAIIAWLIYYTRKNGIRISVTAYATTLLLYAGYFILCGVGFWIILGALQPQSASLSHAVIIFSMAWLLGTIMPGASAGIGVREAVILSLGFLFIGSDLSIAAILLRILTVLADIFLWLVSRRVWRATDTASPG